MGLYTLPTVITVDNQQFHITDDGDFRMVLDCFSALNDEELSEDYRVLASLLIFYNEFNTLDDIRDCTADLHKLVKEMYDFFNCGSAKAPGADTNKPVIDWDADAQMICSAINNVANTEIRAVPNVHWWTFMGYYSAVGESTLSTVVSIRHKLLTHKKLEKWEKDFKKDNPHYFVWNTTTLGDREAQKVVSELWNKQ